MKVLDLLVRARLFSPGGPLKKKRREPDSHRVRSRPSGIRLGQEPSASPYDGVDVAYGQNLPIGQAGNSSQPG